MDIFTLIKANIKCRKSAFIGIAILMYIITLSVTTIISLNDNLENELDDELSYADVGDVLAVVSDEYYTDDFINKLNSNTDLERVREIDSVAATTCYINGEKIPIYTQLYDWEQTSANFRYHVFNEDENDVLSSPADLASGEIYLPLTMKMSYSCSIGDEFTAASREGDISFRIKGFIEEPLMGAYVITSKMACICSADLERLQGLIDSFRDPNPLIIDYHLLHMFQKPQAELTTSQFKKSLNDSSKVIDYSYATLSKEDSKNYTLMLPKTFGNMLYVFVILLFFVVLIVLGNSISTGIEMDYVNLGVLKSQGFTMRKLRRILLLQYLAAEAAGAVIGMLLAIPCVRLLGKLFQNITGILSLPDISILKCVGIAFGILAISSAYIYYRTAAIAGISPVRAISGGYSSVYFDNRGKLPISKKLLGISLAWRQFISDKKQYAGLVSIAAIITYFLISMTILTAGISTESIFEIFGGISCDIELNYNDNYDDSRFTEIEDRINEKTQLTFSLSRVVRYLTVDGVDFNTTIYDRPEEFRSILEGRAPLYDNEIVVTELVSDMLGKGIGETVEVSYYEHGEEYMISGIYQSSAEVGRCIGISLKGARKIGAFPLTSGYIRIEDNSKDTMEELVSMLNQSFGDMLEAKISDNNDSLSSLISLSLNAVTVFIYGVSVLFMLVVVSMVCRRSFLREQKDIGIYKAFGFTSARLRVQFAARFLIIALSGGTIGVVFSLLLNAKMMNLLLTVIGVINFTPEISSVTLLLPPLLLCICFMSFSYVSSRRIRQVSARELITE